MFSYSHFGSDTAGVNTTRRYLCEALSFQYRYVPIGLLERLPPRINERAPAFKGRDELGEQHALRRPYSLLMPRRRDASCQRGQPRLGADIGNVPRARA